MVGSFSRHVRRFLASTVVSVLLAAIFAPMAMATVTPAAPPHACCLRAHHQHCSGGLQNNHDSVRASASCCEQPQRALTGSPAAVRLRPVVVPAPRDPRPYRAEPVPALASTARAGGDRDRAPPARARQ